MRIAQLTAWYPPHSIGGTEIYVEALSMALRRAGHEVAVAGPLAGLFAPEWTTRDGIPVLRYALAPDPTKDEIRGRVQVRTSEPLVAWLRDWKPDIVHVHSLTTGLQLPELGAAAIGARIVLTAHLPSLTYICQRGTLALWGRRACDGIRRRRRCAACALEGRGLVQPLAWVAAATPMALARRARRWPGAAATALAMPALIDELAARQQDLFDLVDAVVVLNRTALRILLENGAPADRVVLNPLGVSYRPCPKPGPEIAPTERPVCVGYFGRLSREKGIEDLLAAIELLPRDAPVTFSFHGIAATAAGQELAARIQQLQTSRSNIALNPPVSPEDVPAALAKIDVLCAPSRWFENGPTIALEAMAAGTPVIGTRLGAFGDFVEDGVNGRLIEPGDAEALARAIREIAADPAGTVDRWRRSLPPVRTMAQITGDYLQLYHRICAREMRPVAK